MSGGERRVVGERGQVTLPKEFRERLGITGGDEVVVHEESGRVFIERPVTREEIAEGYRRRGTEMKELAEEMDSVSEEADEALGDAPEW